MMAYKDWSDKCQVVQMHTHLDESKTFAACQCWAQVDSNLLINMYY